MPHVRAHIRLNTATEASEFISTLNEDHYILESFDGSIRVNAHSLLGVLYIMTEHADEMFAVNLTNDGIFPSVVFDKYRI